MTDSPAPPDELDKLFACLVRVVRDQRPENLASPFTVSDLLAFVPYKAVRAEIGVATDDDYGHAMTQLLAGERGLLFVDDLMQDDMRAELASKNPDLQAYRSYLNTRVALAQERVRDVLDALGPAAPREVVAAAAGGSTEAPAAPRPAPTAPRPAALRPAAPPAAPRERPAAPARTVPNPTAQVGAAADIRASRPGCKYCGQPLPTGRELRFCPYCGQDLSVHRCGACSAELEPGWKFCVSCGRAANG